MASSTNKPQKRRPKRQPSPRDYSDMTCEALHEEIERLHGMLSTGTENLNYEQNLRIKLSQKLKETKQQLADQKAMTDSFIIKEKETTKELERLRQYSNAEALSASNIATQFGNDIKKMKKKDLQENYEELQMAHTITQLRFTGELNVEKNKNKTLQEELEKLRASHHQLSVRYENNTLALRQQVESLQHECEDENKSHARMVEQYIHLIDTLKAEKVALQCELDNEKLTHADRAEQGQKLIDTLKMEKEALQRELEMEKLTHAEWAEQGQQLIDTLKMEKDALQRELENEKLTHADRAEQGQRLILPVKKMASSTNKPQKRRPKRQPSPRDKSNMTCEALHEEIERLHGMLSTGTENLNYEQNLRIKLSQKLKETKQQLADQKAMTDSFIIKEKETTKELERLRQYSNAEALSASNIATQFGNDIKKMKKKDLQEDYEELQMAHTITQLKFTGELNVEKNKNKTLQEELEKLRASHHQLSVRYENNTLTLRQQVESLQHECENENKSHASMVEQYIHLIDTLKAEKDDLQRELDNEKLTHADRAEQGQRLILPVKKMASSTNRPQKWRPKRQPSLRDHSDMTCEALHEEIERLHGMLSTGRENLNYEQNLRIKLSQELKETKQQLADQKAKTDSFIIKEKETTKELERLRQYSNAEALSASNIATQFGNDIKKMKKKDLQEDYEELQMAHTITQLRFTGELNVEKNKNKTLQEELEKLRASHHQLSVRYENNTLTLRQQVESLQHECEDENKSHASIVEQNIHLIDTLKAEKDALQCELETEKLTHADRAEQGQQLIDTLTMEKDALQCELETEKLTHADRAEQGQQLIDNLRTENDCLRKEMAEEVLRMQKEADHKASLYQRELEELRDELKLQTSLNLQLSTQLKAEKLSSCEQPEPEPCEDQEPLPSALHDEELTENAVVSEKIMTETTKQKSRWKRFRHFLGLRKPQKWKK